MGVPKKRKTHGGTGRRRSHHALSGFSASKCGNCGKSVSAHQVCPHCGYYRGRQVVKPKVKKKKVKR